MSLEAMTWAIEMRGLTPSENLVLLLLANRHNNDTGLCYPSVSRIAEESGMHRATVMRAINALEKKGLLTISKTFGKSNHYRLHTGSTVRPVAESDRSQKVTTPVAPCDMTRRTVRPEPKRTRKNPKSQRKKFTDEHMAVAKEMADILDLKRKPNLDKWADTVRLMVEREPNASCAEVMSLFRAAQDDDFWRRNILSPEKLRKQWDTLERQLQPKRRNDAEDKWRYL